MKKFYLFSLLFAGFSFMTFGQEMIVGGDMENAAAWKTSALNMDGTNEVTFEFNYTTDKPTAGTGGCLYISGANAGTSGNNLTNFMFYQQLTLQRGVTYNFDGAYKDVRTNNYWTEVYVGGNEPAVGADYGGDQGAVLVSGFKSKNWEVLCTTDQYDGTFKNDACTPGSTNTVMFEGEGDTIVFFGFRSGIWDDQGSGYTFEVFIDNISLTVAEASSVKDGNIEVSVLPNPFKENIVIHSSNKINEISVVNTFGQQVYQVSGVNALSHTVQLSGQVDGMYFIVVKDYQGKALVTKTVKK